MLAGHINDVNGLVAMTRTASARVAIHLDRGTCLSTSISHISMPFLLTVDESRENQGRGDSEAVRTGKTSKHLILTHYRWGF